ncbi:MAG: N-acetylmuramic acid 6-phosphate etherase [Rhodothermales bacterium]|nr:N-acetylmuramic acid 6-phosphate etherase [Rhodothermales bacterium]
MNQSPKLFDELASLSTEMRNPRTTEIDSTHTAGILELISAEDHLVAPAVAKEIPHIAEAVDLVVAAFKSGGRLFYVGAGTSGRLGVVDASEIPPTFGSDPELVQGIIAGGREAVFRSQEGAEDIPDDGRKALVAAGITNKDVVCGIAASRRTPFVVGAVGYARQLGCKTLFITCNPRKEFDIDVDVAICPEVGPEPIMGSTRMKSGTAQKLVLNMLTTAAMIRMGKVYENMMIDLQMSNAKLVQRARRIVMLATGVTYEQADKALIEADGHVKTALVMILANVDAETAADKLRLSDGFVRTAIGA